MSNESTSSGRSRTWSRRRIAAATLGIATVVGGSAAAASASPYGDGFLRPHAAPATNHPWNAAAPTTMNHPAPSTQWTDRDGDRDGWAWTGHGTNRWGFRSIVDGADRTFNQALGINNKGTLVGYYGSGEDATHPNHGWWTTTAKAGHWFGDVNYPGAVQTQAIGVNDDGTVVGFYVEHDGSNHGFVRWQGHYWQVDAPWTSSSPSFNQLLGISRNGIAAGFYNDRNGNAHGYLYNVRTHRFTPVKLPWGATSVTVTGVNDDGTVVGFAVVKKMTVAFIITRRTTILVNLGNHKNTQVLGVNRKGMVVGSYQDGHDVTHGFVWADGHMRTVDYPHAKSTVVNGLNDSGQIVGFYEDSSGSTKGFLAKQ